MKALVNRIIHHSVVDGPGNRSVVFLQGCNFACSYCHNPETINRCVNCGMCVTECPSGALRMENGAVVWDEALCVQCDWCIAVCPNMASAKVRLYTAAEVMEKLQNDLPFIRGITVSGGECSLQRDFVVELFSMAKEHGLGTLMDSNGSYDYTTDEELMRVCDGIMLDIKAWDEKRHIDLTGKSNRQVLENAVKLAKIGKLEEIRTVVVPDYLNNEETVDQITKKLAQYQARKRIRYKIIAFRQFGVRKPYCDIYRAPSAEELEKLAQIAHGNGFSDVVII